MRKRTPQTKLHKLGSILQTTLKKKNIFINFEDESLIQVWNKALGPQIAAHSRPFQLKGETLFVKVSSSVWMQQLHFMKEDILEKINQSWGKTTVKNIYFSIGEFSLPSLKGKGQQFVPPDAYLLKERDKKLIEKSIVSIQDQELRELLERVMTKEISRRRFMANQQTSSYVISLEDE
ncbi:MAG: DUF721 domain-containing protein [Syntrophales bacterium]